MQTARVAGAEQRVCFSGRSMQRPSLIHKRGALLPCVPAAIPAVPATSNYHLGGDNTDQANVSASGRPGDAQGAGTQSTCCSVWP